MINGFSLQRVPGKGQGLIASRSFTKGEIILSESPLFTQTPRPTNEDVLAAVAKLNSSGQDQFYELSNCHTGNTLRSRNKKIPVPLGIYHTNALPCGFTGPDADAAEGADKGGLFILGSRFNSSCCPNVNNHWDSDLQQIVFRSVRDIEKGEELCISYGNYLARRDLRREELKRKFGFECMCEVCSLEGAELEESERRREHICEIWDQLPNPDPVVGIRQVMLGVKYIEKEGLLGVYEAGFYYFGFQICVTTSDWKNASLWAQKSFEANATAMGEKHSLQYKNYVANPRSHPAASMKQRATLTGPP